MILEPLEVSLFPLANPPVKCGLRRDLPKRQRIHAWADMGLDVRNFGSEGFKDAQIFACLRCGTDKKVSIAAALPA
jgi:hypothetical protein